MDAVKAAGIGRTPQLCQDALIEMLEELFTGKKYNGDVYKRQDKYRVLSAESSAEPGRWHTDKAPYQREIMDAIKSMGGKK